MNVVESANACHTPLPSVAKLTASSVATVATAAPMVFHRRARQQRDRDQDAELRLVGEQADQHAGEPGPAIQQMQGAAKQGGGEKSILAVADVDEYRGEGQRDQRRLGPRKDRAQRRQIGREACHKPDRKAAGIGKGGHQDGDREEEGRIVPAIERNLAAAKHGGFGGMLQRRLIGVGGPSLPGQRPGGVDIGEVGADRLAVAIDQPVRQRDPADDGDHIGAEQDQAVPARPLGGQPSAGSQALPDMSHFATEFYECCASLGGSL